MMKMRRMLSLVLAVVMVLSLGISGVQAAPTSKGISFEKLTGIFNTVTLFQNIHYRILSVNLVTKLFRTF